MTVLGISRRVFCLQSLGGVDDTTALNDVDLRGISGQQIIPYPIYAMNIIILVLINYLIFHFIQNFITSYKTVANDQMYKW